MSYRKTSTSFETYQDHFGESLRLWILRVLLNSITDHHSRGVLPGQYSLKYNVMPYVGLLSYGEAARTMEAVDFPEARDSVS